MPRPGVPLLTFSPERLLPDADPRFRETVELEVEQGINFAGHLVLVAHSCGSGCIEADFVDMLSGRVLHNDGFGSLLVGPFRSKSGDTFQYRGLTFRADSRLLMAEGCFCQRRCKNPHSAG